MRRLDFVKMRKIDKEYYEEKQGSLYLQYYSDLLDGTLKIYEGPFAYRTKPAYIHAFRAYVAIWDGSSEANRKKLETKLIDQLHFQLVYNSAVSYTGYTDCRNQTITMKYQSDAIYHELGHFLAFIAGNADYTSEWRAIYQAEKNKYTKFNKGYVCATQYEYFAESYKDYVLSKTELRQQRPQTYQYIVKTLQTANTRNATTGFWKNMHDNYARIGIWTR